MSKKVKKTKSSSITPHFFGVLENVNKKHASALKMLAGK